MKYTEYTDTYKKEYYKMIKILWNDISDSEIEELIENHKEGKERIYLAIDKDIAIGFLNTSIRQDYVEGSDSNRTGYIEGIYVEESYRRKNIASELIQTCFSYYETIGIDTVGSDIIIGNDKSEHFHKSFGFKEVNRNIHYIYNIKENKVR